MTSADEEPTDRPSGPPPDTGGDLAVIWQWIVVVLLVVFLLVVPGIILLWPPTRLGFRDAYLALAVFPGILFGAVIVWLATRPTD